MITRISVLLVFLTTVAATFAQSTTDRVKTLEAALKQRPRMLRGFSFDHDEVWRWDGSKLVQDTPLSHMLMLEIGSVKLHGSELEIDGTRRELLPRRNNSFELGQLTFSARVRIELAGADPATVLPIVAEALFYVDEHAGLSEVPRGYRGMLHLDGKPTDRTAPDPTHDPACPVDQATGKPVRKTPPQVLHGGDTEFSEEVKGKHLDLNVMVGMQVNTAGLPQDIWVIQPVGLGLDEKAVESAREYKFRPARCGDVPVPVTLLIGVNFHS